MAVSVSSTSRAADVHEKPRRLDIQGLRAIAVGTVLLYHAEIPWMQGGFVGVDIFFVISGFLITGGIVKELRRDGTVSLKDFYVRRVARIIPAATVTLVATLIATWLLLPETRWAQVGKDALASTFYYVNWLFADSSVDYLAQDQASSPLQHFWSLAVEEQFYIFWPALLLLVSSVCLKLSLSLQKGLILAVTLVFLPSLIWSIYYTQVNPGGAYFVTTTRMWELAIGAGLAIAVSKAPAPPKIVAAIVGWTGLAAIGYSAFTYTGALPFPSYTALLPTLGTAAVLWGGQAAGKLGPGLLLNTTPMVRLGGISYSLYLWHWPMIVIVGELIGGITPLTGTLIIIVAIIPATLSYRGLELKAQKAIRDYQGSQLGAGFLLSIIAAAVAVVLAASIPPPPPATTMDFVPAPVGDSSVVDPVGAEIIAAGAPLTIKESFSSIRPSATNAAGDVPLINRNGCMNDRAQTEAKLCSFGDLGSTKIITLVGDSHAAMLAPGFEAFAKQNGYRLDTYTKGACPFIKQPIEFQGSAYTECGEWVQEVTQKILAAPPEMVVTAISRYRVMDGDESLSFEESKQPIADALQASWEPLHEAGIPVSMVRAIPRPDVQVPDCVASNPGSLGDCVLPEEEILWQDGPDVRATTTNPAVHLIDLGTAFCVDGRCPAVIEGILVYRDNNHITTTYARTLDDHIAMSLKPLMK